MSTFSLKIAWDIVCKSQLGNHDVHLQNWDNAFNPKVNDEGKLGPR